MEIAYRIIGYFNVASEGQDAEYQMKLIKAKPIGNYYWSGSSSNASNTWANSTLNKITLNGDAKGNYLHDLGEEWISKIANHAWKVGRKSYSDSATAKQYYETEVGASSSNTTYEAKIGLMYASDYGYGVSQANWTAALSNYNSAASNNWLYLGSSEWLISCTSSGSYSALRVYMTGSVYYNYINSSQYAVCPTFYLESNVFLSSGDGTISNPYCIEN